ncbi:BUD13 homolog [Penaeus monodon]|uniref:BUD13 homolog n=1 Tax=Penaeus monodon TaxID=6687 RepID=UPI0018A72306|nr:BUD13 homolog [Penaeus monodon]
MGKAFARMADDVDMNTKLKQVTREEDPMLEYMMKKQMKETKQPLKPLYKGPFPPNRFNIRPGYRWDGVDRSSGFENQWFERQNNRRAVEEDAYKWSVSDM